MSTERGTRRVADPSQSRFPSKKTRRIREAYAQAGTDHEYQALGQEALAKLAAAAREYGAK